MSDPVMDYWSVQEVHPYEGANAALFRFPLKQYWLRMIYLHDPLGKQEQGVAGSEST